MARTISLTYVSRSLIGGDLLEVDRICQASVINNDADDLTGALYYAADTFFQVIEGREAALWPRFDRIREDPRHEGVIVLAEREIEKRRFSSWYLKTVTRFQLDTETEAGAFSYEALSAADPATMYARIDDLIRAW